MEFLISQILGMVWSSFQIRLDRVLHADLTNLVKCYGISGQVLDIIYSFLGDRKVYVVLGGVGSFYKSDLLTLGFLIIPFLVLLFLLYIDLPDDVVCKSVFCTDDTTHFCKCDLSC